VPIIWELVDVTPVKGADGKFGIPQAAIDSVNKHTIGLKGPLMTPIGKGHRSLNLALRKYVCSVMIFYKTFIILF
jgi:isocitrate dehydrogenase (NAD+)